MNQLKVDTLQPATLTANDVRSRVEALKQALERTRLLRIVLAGAAAAMLVLLAMRALLLLVALIAPGAALSPLWQSVNAPAVRFAVAIVAYVTVMLREMVRSQPITPVRAALWYEEHHPASHAVVTLVENERLTGNVAERLAAQSQMSAQQTLPARWRVLKTPLSLTIAALALLVIVSLVSSTPASIASARSGTAGANSLATTVRDSRLATWRIEVIPPAYSRLQTRSLADSTTVEALIGSRVRVIGQGDTSGLRASLTPRNANEVALPVEPANDANGWFTTTTVSAEPGVIKLSDGEASRLLVIIPKPDSLPLVRLAAPMRDSVYRDTTGILSLSAEVRDDFGLASAAFEVILTSGAGEQFTARTLRLAERALAGARTGRIEHELSLAQLGVKSGDVMHVRAVARDQHPAASREIGVSETRSLRFARAEEYDSVAVEAAPPPAVDSSLLSQRMLLELTIKLEARRTKTTRDVLVAESRKLATEQARIRRAVSAIVYARLSGEGESEHVHYEGDGHDHGLALQEGKLVPSFGGAANTASANTAANAAAANTATGTPARVNNNVSEESPIIAVNLPLLEAYNAMWDAGRALEQADPRAAIPPMRLALAAIQRARAAERVYLRGRVRPIVVDLARVRLAGKDTGQDARRLPGAVVPDRLRSLDARLVRAAFALTSNATAARDSLVSLRLDALADAPAFSQALDAVLTALRDGRDATDALVFARRALARPVPVRGLSGWSVP
jgi:hypothetical protein